MAGFKGTIGLIAWVWCIIIGGIIIFIWPPNPPVCIVCGQGWDITLGVISVAVGVLAIAANYMAAER